MAQIKSLRLANFKSIGGEVQQIDFAPITLLFGPNSAGKSTVLQALVFAREAILHGNLDPDTTDLGGDWLDLGGFKNLIHGRNPEAVMRLGFELSLSGSELPSYASPHEIETLEENSFYNLEDMFLDVESVDVDLEIRWSEDRGRPYVASYTCKLDQEVIATTGSSSDGLRVYIQRMPLQSAIFQDPLDFLDDERSLSQILEESLSQSMIERSTMAISSMARPFISYSIEELEGLLEEDELPSVEVIHKLLEELGHRTTRRASVLEKRVSQITLGEAGDSSGFIEYLNLKNQADALPLYKTGLVYEDDAWSQDFDDSEVDPAYGRTLRLFLRRALDTAICGPLACVASLLEEMTYIGPLRDLPPRQIAVPRTKTTSRWAKGLAAWESLPAMDPQSIDEINYWLGKDCLGSGYQVQLQKIRELADNSPLYDLLNGKANDPLAGIRGLLEELPEKTRVTLQDSENGLSVMPQDIGVGISQLFPVVVASVSFKEALVAIEQPELHVHPRLQTELADMFIRYALDAKNQFLLETHSEHLMLRLLRRVRELGSPAISDIAEIREMSVHYFSEANFERSVPINLDVEASMESALLSKFVAGREQEAQPKMAALSPDDLAVHYVESTPTGTKFTKLRVSPDGDFLDEWPQGFFEERDDEVFF